MIVRLTHIDGKLPNLALMKLSHWHKARGDEVHFSRKVRRGMFEPAYDLVYGSTIFEASARLVEEFRKQFPGASVGGTGSGDLATVEATIGEPIYENYDYSLYPDFTGSIGFAARGCRLKCGFCVVPKKEGKPQPVNTIHNIWRGDPHPKHIHLLDNDFFGNPDWRLRAAEIRDGGFRVCFNQGINVRLIDDEIAEALAALPYYDDQFKTRRLYTAWDNLKDEKVFMRGVNRLERAGIPPTHLLVYMLVGYDPAETWERVLYRFNRMAAMGMRPYPMPFGDKDRTLPLGGTNLRVGHRTLRQFQRWAIGSSKYGIPFDEYDSSAKGKSGRERQASMFAVSAAS